MTPFQKPLLAIDPGACTGFAYGAGMRILHGTWTLSGKHPGGPPASLHRQILDWCAAYSVSAIATEGGYPISRRGADRLEWLRGAVQMAGAELGAPVLVVPPSSLKLFATGSGKAKKNDMRRAVELHLGLRIDDHNEADALMILLWAQQEMARPPRPTKAQARRAKKRNAKLF